MAAETEFYSFPPFFTLQPVEATRSKQLLLWRRLLLGWAEQNPEAGAIALDSFPLFRNAAIDRSLSTEGRRAVADELVSTGHAAWEDPGKTLHLFVKTPSEWAALILDFIQSNGLSGTIYTLYELHSGDLTRDTPLQGIQPALCLKALQVLESSAKVEIYHSTESLDETGVKFL